MAATIQDLETLREAFDKRINAVDERISTGAANLSAVHDEINMAFEDLRNQISQPGNVVHSGILGIVNQASETLTNRINICEQEILRSRSIITGPKWNIKDPKARGTVKFAGEQKDDVRVFTQWRKHAVIYLEKFIPRMGKFLEEMNALTVMEGIEVSNIIAKNRIDVEFDVIQDTLHYFLFEHLTDSAADLVESCGLDGCGMWRMINSYYEPILHSTHANVHAAVYEMSRRKAKTPAEMHGLLRELEKRLVKLKQIDGDISDIAKASIVYNMMDDVTQKNVCDAGKNADFDYMRLKIIREGCESREKAILKHTKAVPMDLDSLKPAEGEGGDCQPCGAEVNAVTNPNIVCFVCKEKGHIARNCPHNDGKTSKPLTPSGRGDDWWYSWYSGKGANKGNGKSGGKGGKGKGKYGKGAGRKGYGKAYSLENADDWENDWWMNAVDNQGNLRSLERLSTLQHVKDQKPVKIIEKEPTEVKTKGKLKYKPTDLCRDVLHNSISYNNMVKAFSQESNSKIASAKTAKSSWPETPKVLERVKEERTAEIQGSNDAKAHADDDNGDDQLMVKEHFPELVDSDDEEEEKPSSKENEVEDMVPPWLDGGEICRECKMTSEIAAMSSKEFHFCSSCREAMKKNAERPRKKSEWEREVLDVFDEFIERAKNEKTEELASGSADVPEYQTAKELISEVKEKMYKKMEMLRKAKSGKDSEADDLQIVKKIKVRKEKPDEDNVDDDDGNFFMNENCEWVKKINVQKERPGEDDVNDDDGNFFMSDDSEWVEVSYKKPQRYKKGIQSLSEIREGALSAMVHPEWEEITITVDSGASETVAPLSMGVNIPIESSEASLRGVKYEVANGGVVHNKGEKNCIVQAVGGSAKLLCFQVCDVHKPLLAVSKLCEAGNAVIFHPAWSYIENLKTGERTTLEKREGLYELRAWVRAAKGFGRQGQAP